MIALARPLSGRLSRHQVWLLAIAALLLLASWTLSITLVVAGTVALAVVLLTLRYPVVGFALLGFAVPWGNVVPTPLGSSLVGPTDLLVAAVGIAWLVHAADQRSFGWDRAPLVPYIALFLVAMLISVSQATDLGASARELIKWAELAVVYVAGSTFLISARDIRIVAAAIVVAGVGEALLGFMQSGLMLGPSAFASRLLLRAYGTFDQPNPYAGYLNIALGVAVGFALLSERRLERSWYSVAAAIIALAVLASESRGALLAGVFAVGVALAYASAGWRRLFWGGLLGLTFFALLASFGLVPSSLSGQALNATGLGNVSFTSVTDANFSAVERAAHWLAGVRMFAAHPLLGVGIGNYGAAYPAYHPRGWYASLDHAHNYFINIAAEAGIIGLTTYLLLLGSALWYVCLSMRRAHARVYRAAGLGVLAALLSTSFHNLFDVLYVHGIVPLLGLLLALASVTITGSQKESQVPVARDPGEA